MEKNIILKNDGYLVSVKDKTIFFPNAELMNYGCKNCVWKLHSQCPYGLTGDESYPGDVKPKVPLDSNAKPILDELDKMFPKGICPEMIEFLSSLGDGSDDLTVIWEKFHIYKARLQESADYKDFLELEKKIKKMESELDPSSQSQQTQLDNLRMDKTAAKIWWVKLNSHVIQSMQKIADRTAKSSSGAKSPGIFHAETINFNTNTEKKQIEEKKDGNTNN